MASNVAPGVSEELCWQRECAIQGTAAVCSDLYNPAFPKVKKRSNLYPEVAAYLSGPEGCQWWSCHSRPQQSPLLGCWCPSHHTGTAGRGQEHTLLKAVFHRKPEYKATPHAAQRDPMTPCSWLVVSKATRSWPNPLASPSVFLKSEKAQVSISTPFSCWIHQLWTHLLKALPVYWLSLYPKRMLLSPYNCHPFSLPLFI